MKEFTVDKLHVVVAETNEEMGKAAAEAIHRDLLALAQEKDEVRVMFAAAPSQNTTLEALCRYDDIPWGKVVAFHMDEYVGITDDKPQSFRQFLKAAIFGKKPFKAVNYILGDAPDAKKEAERYAALLAEKPLDLIVLGIGENGHIAFNDPPDADFNDPKLVKVIRLSERSRIQQVNDGCFSLLEAVPKYAITVTIPAFLSASRLHCAVPNDRKAEAVKNSLEGPVVNSCPASVLRTHEGASLYLDKESASLLK